MEKVRTIRDLAERYWMHPKTFKRHIREILLKNNCTLVRVDVPLEDSIIAEIEKLMGDYRDFVGSTTIKKLAEDYGLSYPAMKYRLRPIKHLLKAKVRGKYILSSRDVREIHEFLGPP
jgi:hypothetical protein